MDNQLDVIQSTYFQIKPTYYSHSNRHCYADLVNDYVMFCNEVFRITDVFHVGQVDVTAGRSYDFQVSIRDYNRANKTMTFSFETRREAITAKNELARALTATGEFSPIVKSEVENNASE